MHPARRLIRVAAACLVLAACSSATTSTTTTSIADNSEAATALRTAAEKTLGVDSFHAQTTFQIPSSSGKGTVDYQAPDREHLRWGAGTTNETISIGDTVYVSALGRPGHFWKIDGHGEGASDTLGYLRYLEGAENVRLDGYLTYHFDLPPNPGGPGEGTTSGVATLTADGLINTLLYHYQLAADDVTLGFAYSGFNSGITVEPPPAALIVEAPSIGCPASVQPADALPNSNDICQVLTSTPSP